MRLDSVKVVSFSGIDGAGKSTQIDALCRSLRARGFQCVLYTFWDDIVAFSKLRERISLRAFKGDEGIGSPAKPIVRRDKNVSSPKAGHDLTTCNWTNLQDLRGMRRSSAANSERL